jgi:hypothetical protein
MPDSKTAITGFNKAATTDSSRIGMTANEAATVDFQVETIEVNRLVKEKFNLETINLSHAAADVLNPAGKPSNHGKNLRHASYPRCR